MADDKSLQGAAGSAASPASREQMTDEQLLREWDAEVAEHGIWTSGHSIGAIMASRLRAALGGRTAPELHTTKENRMNFGEAIAAMKDGKCVQRSGWNGKGMHIYLEDRYSMALPNVKEAGMFRGTTREYEPVICMFNAQGKHQPGWLANQPDMLADDWQIVDGNS